MRLAMAGLAASGLSACAENIGSAVVGLPAEDFDRAYVAGLDIAAAQRCGVAVDAGVVRINLVEDAKRRGRNDATAEKAGRAFDKTRAEFARKLQSRPEFCVSEPPRICRRLQLLRDWSHDESQDIPEVFHRGA